MDAYEKLFVKIEAERKLAEKKEAEEMLTDKIEDEKRTKGTTENEAKLIDAFQTDKQADDSTEEDVESSDTEIHAGMVEVPQTDEITEATLEAAAETERLAEETESLQIEDEQTGILVDAEDSDSAESLSQKAEDTQTGKLTDDVSESVVEDSVAAESSTEKIDDTGTDDQTGEVIETENQKDEIKSLEETENEKKQSVKVEPEMDVLGKLFVKMQADDSTEEDVESSDTEIHAGMVEVPQTDEITEATLEAAAETERPVEEAESLQIEDEQAGIVVDAEDSDSAESLNQKTEVTQKKTYLIGSGILTIIIAGVVIILSNRTQTGKLTDDVSESVVENSVAAESPTEKIDDTGTDDQAGEVIETENQKDEIKPLEETENEKKQSVKVEPEERTTV